MLRGLAAFAMQGRWQASFMAAVLAAAGLLIAPLSYLSGGVVALSTLRMGQREGGIVVLTTTVIMGLLAGFIFGQPLLTLVFVGLFWLPVWAVTVTLGNTRSLAASVLGTGLIGLVVVLIMQLAVAEPAQWWQQQLTQVAALLTAQEGWNVSAAETSALLLQLAPYMTGIMAAGMSLNCVLSLFIGRGWQATLYQPQAFATEFAAMRYGKQSSLVMAGLVGLALSPVKEFVPGLADMVPVLLLILALQGLAVVHTIFRQRQWHGGWLFLVYSLVVLRMPQMAALLAVLGISAYWFNISKKMN